MMDIVTFHEKYLFHEHFNTQTVLEQSTLLSQNLKDFSFVLHYHVKSEGRSFPENPDIIKALKNFREKLLLELRQCSFNAPQNGPFFFVSWQKKHFWP